MMRMTLVLAAATAAAAAQEPAMRVKSSVEKTRSQKSYSVTFTATVRVPDSSDMVLKGESVWVTPGVLFTQYTASGGDEVRLLRAGDKVWLYHVLVEDWVTAEENGKPGAGRGVQNPDEVLTAVLKTAEQAVAAGQDGGGSVLEMKLDGPMIQEVMRQQVADGKLDYANSNGVVRLVYGPDGLMRGMQVRAEVASNEPHLKGKKIGYTADVTLKSYNQDFGMEFTIYDPVKKAEVPLSWTREFIDEALKVPGIPDELKAELRKRAQK